MDREANKLGGAFRPLSLGLADITVKAFFDSDHKSFDRLWRAFCFQADPTVGHIFYPAGNLKLLRHLKRRITKTDTLNPAGKKHSFVMNFRHSVERKTYGQVAFDSIRKTGVRHLRTGNLRCILSKRKQRNFTIPATP
jgi:hypothetical protein